MKSTHPIVVALDFSPSGSVQVNHAWRLAEAQGCPLHFLHVLPKGSGGRDGVDEVRTSTLQHLQQFTGLPQTEGASRIEFTHQVCIGSPAREIVNYAKECSAGTILVGTRGRGRLVQVIVGSVAQAILRDSPCPVLVIPENSHWNVEQSVPQTTSDMQATHEIADWNARFPEIELEQSGESNRVIELLRRAVQWRATDIHIDSVSPDRVWIRFRVDGKLHSFCQLDQKLAAPLLMQIRLMANLDTTQTFDAQEGRLHLPPALGMMEVRVTLVPACDGDAVAMRILWNDSTPRPLDSLGMSPPTLEAVQHMLHHRAGLVLVTGPTGTGKTTTVYAMLQILGSNEQNIVSIEDPVEYRVPGIRQLSVDSRHNLTMTRGLRTLLRMDPDVVFIGEIRDVEALEIAMRASSSGRYVFSTLHTRDVPSTITALRDLHADSYSLAANLTGIVSQRLIRCLCRQCRVAVPISDEERHAFLLEGIEPPQELYQSQGCSNCQSTGYRNRIGVFEAVVANDEIVAGIQRGVSEEELRAIIQGSAFHSMKYDALTKVRDGITSFKEACSISWV